MEKMDNHFLDIDLNIFGKRNILGIKLNIIL